MYNKKVMATWTRLAAVLLAVVLCADLAGLDCADRLSEVVPCASSTGGSEGTGAGSQDCFCCSAAEAPADMSPTNGAELSGLAWRAPRATTVDGVRPVPYHPPLFAPLPIAL